MTKRVLPASMMSGVVLGALVLAGCSDGSGTEKEAPVSKSLQVCEQFLGAENVRKAVDSVGGGEEAALARHAPGDLAAALSREAEEWSEGDLLHNANSACRIDIPAEGDGAFVIEASVAWSVLTDDLMSEPKYAKTWRRLNDHVFVESGTGQPIMRLLVACGVPGAPSGQQAGLPLQMTVIDSGLPVEQREALLSTFARTLVDELACTDNPTVPAQLLSG
ncbi:hypothetical protein ACFT9I_17690 [Streptomyces sp. NPDC057137]|uniref:hypothetical protein n=1 Tax=Streptomyces sp. NPDC057137 TaxID=3346030 RepID=UPI0036434B6D